MNRPSKAIIIAAGRGRRLMPYTDQMPKCLVPIAGRSMLAWQMAAFRDNGVTEFVAIRGYLGEVLTRRLTAISADLGCAVRFVDNLDYASNNILHSLLCAREELVEPVYITYSDIVFTPSVVRSLAAADGDICLTIDRDFALIYEGRTEHPLSEAEVADLDEQGRVRRVGKRALPPTDAFGEFIGLAKLSAAGTNWLTEAWTELCERYAGRLNAPFQRASAFVNAYLTDMWQHLIDAGRPVTPVEIRGCWREIDTVQDLQRADSLIGSAEEDWK